MIEIEHLTKSIGLATFRYRAYPLLRYDDIPISQLSSEAKPAADADSPAPSQGSSQVGPSQGMRAEAARVPGPAGAPEPRAAPTLARIPPSPLQAPARPVRPSEPAMRRFATAPVPPIPRFPPARPAAGSVLGEVADVLAPPVSAPGTDPNAAPADPNAAPGRARSGRYSRVARSAWRAATTSPPPS